VTLVSKINASFKKPKKPLLCGVLKRLLDFIGQAFYCQP
jgi:hypothetical protein